MNDPEIIRKLEEIKEELSEIKQEVSKIDWHFNAIAICFWIGAALFFIIEVVIPWIRDFLF